MKALLIALFLVSCQSHHSQPLPQSRGVASGSLFQNFVRTLSQRSNTAVDDIENSILTYIKTRNPNNTHYNYQLIGITEDQAKQIKSLSDDLPFMPKVQKWAMENMDIIPVGISKNMLMDVYETVVVRERGLVNPYVSSATASQTTRRARRARTESVSPIQSLSQKEQRVLASIREINDSSVENIYRKNLAAMQNRGRQNPAIHANGQEIVESAAIITRKTGHRAMGEGCEQFSKSASAEVLEIKANVDLYRAQLVQERAIQKAGTDFASVGDIPASARLTAQELDDITAQSFRDVLGYTDDEARAALSRLKRKPCKLY